MEKECECYEEDYKPIIYNGTDDYYDDDNDTLIMDLSDNCDKSDDSPEENESILE